MSAPTFATKYVSRIRSSFNNNEPSLTIQSAKDETDINLIMSKYSSTGVLTHTRENPGEYTEVSPLDFQEAMNTVIKAETMFSDLPSDIRKKFGGNPLEFLEFTSNPENLPEMVKLGLAIEEDSPAVAPEPAPKEVQTTTPENPDLGV